MNPGCTIRSGIARASVDLGGTPATRYRPGAPISGFANPSGVCPYADQGAAVSSAASAVLFVLASGLSSLFGFGSNVLALSLLPVVVVTPISSVYPLITVLLVRLFLRHHERVTRQTVLGALLVVSGVILVTLARSAR